MDCPKAATSDRGPGWSFSVPSEASLARSFPALAPLPPGSVDPQATALTLNRMRSPCIHGSRTPPVSVRVTSCPCPPDRHYHVGAQRCHDPAWWCHHALDQVFSHRWASGLLRGRPVQISKCVHHSLPPAHACSCHSLSQGQTVRSTSLLSHPPCPPSNVVVLYPPSCPVPAQ